MSHLKNKVVIITGASSGIGAAAALALTAAGAHVIAVALDEDALNALQSKVQGQPGTLVPKIANVTQSEALAEVAAFAKQEHGRIDVLINNAGLMLFSAWTDLAVDDWRRMIDVNIHGYLNGIAAVLPTMLEQGSGQILNMDSVAGHQVSPSAGVYCATKFFVQAITESMRKEVGVHNGIRVSTISPGVVDTGWADKVAEGESRRVAKQLNAIAIAPDDIAKAVLFALDQPENVTVNDLIVSPTKQDW